MAASALTSIHWITAPWDEMQAELKIQSDRATMYGLRAVGRAVAAGAKARAPVYKGSDPRVGSGDLRRSIKSSRMITGGAGTYQLTVMPAASRKSRAKATKRKRKARSTSLGGVPVYRRKMEEMYGYIRAGMDVAEADAVRVFEDAYRVAFEKFAP